MIYKLVWISEVEATTLEEALRAHQAQAAQGPAGQFAYATVTEDDVSDWTYRPWRED